MDLTPDERAYWEWFEAGSRGPKPRIMVDYQEAARSGDDERMHELFRQMVAIAFRAQGYAVPEVFSTPE